MTRPKRLAMVAANIPPVLTGLLLFAGSATADTSGYHVANTQGLGVTVRSAPSQQASATGHLPDGAAITIACQTAGNDVNGSRIWDKLNTGNYLSDYYTDTPQIGDFSPGVARCDTTPTPPGQPGVDPGRTNQAIGWFEARNGSTAYEWRCQAAVDDAYGSHRYPTALDNWQDASRRGTAHPGDLNPPRGALVFWNISQWGHVGIARGDGTFVSTNVNNHIGAASLPHFNNYLGWAWPNFG
jgi:hypothetical protein